MAAEERVHSSMAPPRSCATKRRRSLVLNYFIQAYNEYAKRLRPFLALKTHWYKTDEDLEAAVRKDAGVVVRIVFPSPKISNFNFLVKTSQQKIEWSVLIRMVEPRVMAFAGIMV